MTYEFEGKTEKEAIELAANELGLQRGQFFSYCMGIN